MSTNDVLLNKGEARLTKDLDIVKVLGKIRNIDETQKATFDQRELTLLKFNRKSVISTGTESSGSEF